MKPQDLQVHSQDLPVQKKRSYTVQKSPIKEKEAKLHSNVSPSKSPSIKKLFSVAKGASDSVSDGESSSDVEELPLLVRLKQKEDTADTTSSRTTAEPASRPHHTCVGDRKEDDVNHSQS